MDTLTKVPSKPRYNRVALAGPAEPPPFVPTVDAEGAAFHGFEPVMTMEQYEAAARKESCGCCAKDFTRNDDTLRSNVTFYCSRECYDRDTAILVKPRPKGESYYGIDI